MTVAGGSEKACRFWCKVSSQVANGNSLSSTLLDTTLQKYQIAIALLEAGEASGELEKACYEIYQYFRWRDELRQRMITVLLYPLFSLCVLFAVAGFLFVSVVPSLEGFLIATQADLLWHTDLLLAASDWVSRYYVPCFVFLSGCFSLIYLGGKVNANFRSLRERAIMKFPALGLSLIHI